ncbi:proteasome assembly chaperone 1-like [Palaemon carinicauda]|uniref:proteasome assembly chaperone 1-like n=1 Tax=Palaemon carinicauda TaxID=392227 RepID=UPI0035B5B96E
MALDFGEPVFSSSRAYDELEDDDTCPSNYIKQNLFLNLKDAEGAKSRLSKCEALIISYGTLALDFCETLLLSKECIDCGTIKVEKEKSDVEDTGDFRPRKLKSSSLFLIQDSVLVCNVSQDVTADLANMFADMILGLVSPSCKVMALSSHHYGQLHGNYNPQEDTCCIIHSLVSPAFKYPPAYSQLPQPATLDSVPAAILTRCIVEKRPCVAYPVFTETYSTADLDLVVDSLIKVFNCNPFKSIVSSVDQSKLHQYRERNLRKDVLYRYM